VGEATRRLGGTAPKFAVKGGLALSVGLRGAQKLGAGSPVKFLALFEIRISIAMFTTRPQTALPIGKRIQLSYSCFLRYILILCPDILLGLSNRNLP
jgi:hypothetical protein